MKLYYNTGMNDTLWVLGFETWTAENKLQQVESKVIKLSISQIKINNFVQHMAMTGFQSHLNNTWIRQIWSQFGFCPEFGPKPRGCFNMRPTGNFLPRERTENVISAVYALANTLHLYLSCNTTQCNTSLARSFDYERFLRLMKRAGNRFEVPDSSMFIEFNEDGDVTVNAYNYEIFYAPIGRGAPLGRWYSGSQKNQLQQHDNRIEIDETVLAKYNPVYHKKPVATCAFPCQPGTYKLPGLTPCCWKCLACYNDEISDTVDAISCQKCKRNEIPSPAHDRCIPLADMRLSPASGSGKMVIVFSALGFVAVNFVLAVFVLHWDTPVVKSSSREISVIQLICMMLLFCYPVLHFVQTTTVTCILRTALFCSLHTLILAFILLKTYRLLRVFQPKRFSKISRFLHNKYQVSNLFFNRKFHFGL